VGRITGKALDAAKPRPAEDDEPMCGQCQKWMLASACPREKDERKPFAQQAACGKFLPF
jgi:hypothetical protein